ncbi:hypothetical protein PV11_00542 [Exophiala sideris]|uniref:Uncharacterized protein n=1 Tax=Exophiala sideris TaxID=1016849 RepID=A0A0D1YTF1_9EURO|nr:hypothetical protein PV11_00542 [Exophiala sideris]
MDDLAFVVRAILNMIPSMTAKHQSERNVQAPGTSSAGELQAPVPTAAVTPHNIQEVSDRQQLALATSPAHVMTREQIGQSLHASLGMQSKTTFPQDRRNDQHNRPRSFEEILETDTNDIVSTTLSESAMGQIPEEEKFRMHHETHSTPASQDIRRNSTMPRMPQKEQTQQSEDFVHVRRHNETEQSVQIQQKDRVIARLENNILNLKNEFKLQAEQYKKAVSERTTLLQKRNTELDGAHSEIRLLKKDLEDCKERIFAMQPVQGMSDTQLLDAYNGLCRNIEEWVETCFDEVDNALIRMADAQKRDKKDSLVWLFFPRIELQAIAENNSMDKPMLMSFIFRVLYDHILMMDIPVPGLPRDCEVILNSLTDCIGKVHPAKGKFVDLFKSLWRLDMYRALRASQLVEECEKPRLAVLANWLLNSFETVVPNESKALVNKDKLDKIISMAADLASNMRLSMADYGFSFGLDPRASAENRVMVEKDLKSYITLDSRTGMLLRSTSQVQSAIDGRVGEMISWVFPGFVRSATKKEKHMELCKPVIVVKFDHEVPRGGKRKGTG